MYTLFVKIYSENIFEKYSDAQCIVKTFQTYIPIYNTEVGL